MTTELETPDVFDRADALTLTYGLDWPQLRRAGRLTDVMIADAVASVTPEQLAAHRARVALTVEEILERAR